MNGQQSASWTARPRHAQRVPAAGWGALILLLLLVACEQATPTVPPTTAPSTGPTPGGSTTPTSPPTPVCTAEPTPAPPSLSAADQSALFDEVWKAVSTSWVYSTSHASNLSSLYTTYKPLITEATSPDGAYRGLTEMIQRLDDDHSVFVDPALRGSPAGVGVRLTGAGLLVRTRDARIRYVVPGSPAASAPLYPFDVITAIDDIPTAPTSASGTSRSAYDVSHQLLGAACTEVKLTVQTATRSHDVTLRRAPFSLDWFVTVAPARADPAIAYLDLPSFAQNGIAQDARDQLELYAREKEVSGLIIDLRQNDGGFIREATQLLEAFVDGGSAGYWKTEQSTPNPIQLQSGRTLPGLRGKPIVVLVSNLTESAAEMFAAVMKYRRAAVILGSRTAGNTEWICDALPDPDPYQSRLALAMALYELPDKNSDGSTPVEGRSLEHKGILPTIITTDAWSPRDNDPQIAVAIDQIQKAIAAGTPTPQPSADSTPTPKPSADSIPTVWNSPQNCSGPGGAWLGSGSLPFGYSSSAKDQVDQALKQLSEAPAGKQVQVTPISDPKPPDYSQADLLFVPDDPINLLSLGFIPLAEAAQEAWYDVPNPTKGWYVRADSPARNLAINVGLFLSARCPGCTP